MNFKLLKKKIKPFVSRIAPYTETAERAVEIALKMSKPSLTGYLGVASSVINNLNNYLDVPDTINSETFVLVFPESYVIDAISSWGFEPKIESSENVQQANFKFHGLSITVMKSLMKVTHDDNGDGLVKDFIERLAIDLDARLPKSIFISPKDGESQGFEMKEKPLTIHTTKQGQDVMKMTKSIMNNDPDMRRAILFTGKPGVGKTTKAQEVARDIGFGGRNVVLAHSVVASIRGSKLHSFKKSLSLLKISVLIIDDIDKLDMGIEEIELFRSISRLVIFTANNGTYDDVLDAAMIRPDRIDETFKIVAETAQRDEPFDRLTTEQWERVREWPIAYLNELALRIKYRPDNLSINEIEERLSRRTRSGGKLYREQNDYEKKEVTFDAEIFGDEE